MSQGSEDSVCDGGGGAARRPQGAGNGGEEHGRDESARASEHGSMSSRSNGAKSPRSRMEATLTSRAVDLHASPLKRRIASPERVKAQSAARVSEEGEDSPGQGDEGYMWPLLGSKHSQDEISEHFWGDAVRRMHLLEQENREKTFEKAKNLFEAHARKESNHPRSQEPFLPKLKLHGLNRNKSISLESLITPRGVNVAKMQRLVSADTSFESQTR